MLEDDELMIKKKKKKKNRTKIKTQGFRLEIRIISVQFQRNASHRR